MLLRNRERIRVAALAACVTLTTAAWAHSGQASQPGTGAITGIASDETGAAVPDVHILVTNDTTALRREVTTGPEGTFALPALPPGEYTLRAERAGFAAHEIPNIVVTANDQVTVRVQLKVDAFNEGVVVTAQKRGEERLQDVPVPVAVVDADRLASTSQLRLRDYYSTVPGLTLAPNIANNSALSIRGVTTGGFGTPTVGVTVDDVPYGGSTLYSAGAQVPDFDPGDLARVEVLRGPQGALYGANSMGGLVKYITKDPTFDRVTGRVEIGLGSVYNAAQAGFSLRASANVPLSDTVGIRASGYTRQDPGYIDNPVYALDGINKARASGGRVTALWRPSDRASLRLAAVYERVEADGNSEVVVKPGLNDLQQDYLAGSGEYDRTVQAYSAVLKAKLGGIDLASVTGYNINHYTIGIDFSDLYGSLVESRFGVSGAPLFDTGGAAKFTQELRASGSLRRRFDWLAGAYYTHEDAPERYDILAVDTATQQTLGIYSHFYGPNTFSERAVFAALTYRATARFDVQVGGRASYTSETNEATYFGPYAEDTLGGSPAVIPPVSSEADAMTYLVTPRFTVSPSLMIYARLASGYRPGTGNTAAIGVPPKSNPDTTRNYEAGLKGDLFGRRLIVDASFYYIDWQDIQISLYTPRNNIYTANGSGAKSQGVELSLETRPRSGLSVSGWIAYDNAVLTQAFPANSSSYGVPGDRLPNTPRFSAQLSGHQEFPLWSGATGFAAVDVAYVGDRVSVFTNSPERQRFPDYAKTDLRAGVRLEGWTVAAYVNNVADTRGILQGGLGYLFPNAFAYITPRTFGVSLSRAF